MKLNDGTKISMELSIELFNIYANISELEQKISEFGRMSSEKIERQICENLSEDLLNIKKRIGDSIK